MSGLKGAELGVLFVSAPRMRSLNLRWRGIDKETDVLSFPGEKKPLKPGLPFALGDIVVNPALAFKQAKEHGLSFKEELRWLLVHGLLHLIGYDHERSGYAEQKMRRKELEVLEKLS